MFAQINMHELNMMIYKKSFCTNWYAWFKNDDSLKKYVIN
jgi:hypothetical protein